MSARVHRPAEPSAYVDLPVDHLLILPPNLLARNRIAAALSIAQVEAAQDTSHGGLRVAAEGLDYQTLLEAVGASLSDAERRDTGVAVIPRWADEATRDRAIAAARPLCEILEECSASWVCRLLRRGGLAIHFQPLVQFPPWRVYGYECLLRGVSSDGRLVPPARLFDAAAKLGMQYLLDYQGVRAALAAGTGLGFCDGLWFINVIAAAVEDPGESARAMVELAERAGLRPWRVVFEITDAEGVVDRRHLFEVVRGYRAAGFRISLDDVGAGGASLLPLGELRPDYIKVDGAVCRGALHSRLECDLLHQLGEVADELGIVAIAKGLENADQLRLAQDAGLRLTQGFIHGSPGPAPLDVAGESRLIARLKRIAQAQLA
jgi:EAL domain-containing protein (putative c-di-GMP-specific phosphodiesterase class I)